MPLLAHPFPNDDFCVLVFYYFLFDLWSFTLLDNEPSEKVSSLVFQGRLLCGFPEEFGIEIPISSDKKIFDHAILKSVPP